MIDRVSGAVQTVGKDFVTVNLGPISFRLYVANSAKFNIDQEIDLYVHMHWNQEHGPSFFGFGTELERAVFLLVISCSGVGPKIGLSVLRDLGAESFLHAVQMEDERALGKVGGLGPKKVEQMIVQLRRKVDKLVRSGIEISGSGVLTDRQNVSDVLTSLNYSRGEVSRAMKFLNDNYTNEDIPFDGLIRHALSFLAKKR